MKSSLTIMVAALCLVFSSSVLSAVTAQEIRSEADKYYEQQNYSKAYRAYYKLAKAGSQYSQGQVAIMYANGEGKKVDFEEAYAWSMLAAENGDEVWKERSQEYLLKVRDKARAEKEAEKLKKKYGRQALEKKAAKRESIRANHEMGACTGRRLGCSGR